MTDEKIAKSAVEIAALLGLTDNPDAIEKIEYGITDLIINHSSNGQVDAGVMLSDENGNAKGVEVKPMVLRRQKEYEMKLNEFIDYLQSLKDELKILPVTVIAENGLHLTPRAVIETDNGMPQFASGKPTEVVITW